MDGSQSGRMRELYGEAAERDCRGSSWELSQSVRSQAVIPARESPVRENSGRRRGSSFGAPPESHPSCLTR